MAHKGFDSLGLGVADDYVEYWVYLPTPPAGTAASLTWLQAQATLLMGSLRQWTGGCVSSSSSAPPPCPAPHP